ncbi:MAG TPA: MarR family transcriptional regulator [Acidimicrobiales bacterium]
MTVQRLDQPPHGRARAGTASIARLETALTEAIRLARDPRLMVRMSAAIDPSVDRRLLLILNLIADRGPLRASKLIDVMAVDQSTVSRQLSALEEHGLVVRTVDPLDRRAALVSVTPAGRAAIGVARRAWRRELGRLTASWTAEERVLFVELLIDLATGLERIVHGDAGARTST